MSSIRLSDKHGVRARLITLNFEAAGFITEAIEQVERARESYLKEPE